MGLFDSLESWHSRFLRRGQEARVGQRWEQGDCLGDHGSFRISAGVGLGTVAEIGLG